MQNDASLSAATWVMALGTLILAAIALFGNWIRELFWRPILAILINNKHGEIVRWNAGSRGIYYHLKIGNRGRSGGENARVFCVGISKSRPGGSFAVEPMVGPEQLSWRFSQVFGTTRRIPPGYTGQFYEVCDLGWVNENEDRFNLALYAKTESFPGYLTKGESLQLSLVVIADNFLPREAYNVRVSWDGQWFDNLQEMEKHLVIEELAATKL